MVGSSKSPQQSRNPIPLKDVINHSYNRSKTSNHTRGNSNNGLKTEERKNNLKFNSPAKSTYERLNGDKKTTPGGGISHPKNVTEYTEPLPSGSKQNGSSELDSHNKSVIDYSKNRLEVRHDINFQIDRLQILHGVIDNPVETTNKHVNIAAEKNYTAITEPAEI